MSKRQSFAERARDRALTKVARVWAMYGVTHPEDPARQIVTSRDGEMVRLFDDEAAFTFDLWVEDGWEGIWDLIGEFDDEPEVDDRDLSALPLDAETLLAIGAGERR